MKTTKRFMFMLLLVLLAGQWAFADINVAPFDLFVSADIGFANKSFTQQGPMAGKGKWVEIDPGLYDKLPQGAVILRYGLDNNPKESKAFFDFLYGAETRAILTKHGYIGSAEKLPGNFADPSWGKIPFGSLPHGPFRSKFLD